MPCLSAGDPLLPPAFAAGIVLTALHLLDDTDVARPTASSVIEALGSTRSSAYAAAARLRRLLPSLVRGRGRPPKDDASHDPPPTVDTVVQLQGEMLDYLLRHPGAASRGEHRRRFGDGFRLFVLDLAQRHPDVGLEPFARAVRVPLGTLKDWLGGGRAEIEAGLHVPNPAAVDEHVTHARLLTILQAYDGWSGSFVDFCTHVQHHLRIPFSHSLIRDLLHAEGVRLVRRRPGVRDLDAEALRGQFETFGAGTQWVADGSIVCLQIAGQPYAFNLELVVDTHTGAWTGFTVTPTEDAQALLDAFGDSVENTGEAPLALLVDNKPSNHTDDVVDVLAVHHTDKIRATPGRAQNKAHVEGGGFGLFKKNCPDLIVDSLQPEDVGRTVLELVVTVFGRALNHRPRPVRDHQSRVDQYRTDQPTAEERQRARAALKARAEQQERARERLLATLDPALRQHLDDVVAELGLEDPDEHFRAALARYPADAVIAGLAIYRKKHARGTLPDGADIRYLLGIVRNLAQADEGYALAQAIWQERITVRDRVLSSLRERREELELDASDPQELIRRLIDHAMASERRLDRAFWLRATADVLLEEPLAERTRLFRLAARRVHGTHRVPHRERLTASRRLAAMALPIP